MAFVHNNTQCRNYYEKYPKHFSKKIVQLYSLYTKTCLVFGVLGFLYVSFSVFCVSCVSRFQYFAFPVCLVFSILRFLCVSFSVFCVSCVSRFRYIELLENSCLSNPVRTPSLFSFIIYPNAPVFSLVYLPKFSAFLGLSFYSLLDLLLFLDLLALYFPPVSC